MPPSAVLGVSPIVVVAVARDVVIVSCSLPMGEGDNGGGDEGMSAAATTYDSAAITTSVQVPLTTPHPLFPLPGDAHRSPLVRAGNAPALLPMAMIMISRSNSRSGRGRASGGPRGARQLVDHSLPPPAVVVVRAARHSSDRPSILTSTSLVAVPPRPGPASLLPSSLRPQPGRHTQRGGRAGQALRAAGITG